MNACVYTSAAGHRRSGDGYRRMPAFVLLLSTMTSAVNALSCGTRPVCPSTLSTLVCDSELARTFATRAYGDRTRQPARP